MSYWKGLMHDRGFNRLLLPALLVSLIAYTIIRTFTVDITWDEAATWLSFARFGFWKPQDAGFLDANNHILNTWFMVIWNQWLGSEVWMLRLHSILFSGMYLISAMLLVKKIPEHSFRSAAFVLLVAHPYMLDFLSLARGYGISLGLNMASWYLTYRYLEKPRPGTLMGILLLSALSVTAYFGQLNLTFCLWTCLLLHRILLIRLGHSGFRASAGAFALLILIPLLFLIWLLPLLFKMQQAGNFYAGGQKGFFQDTLMTLAMNMQYGKANSTTISIAILLIFALGVFYWLPKLRFIKQNFNASRIFPAMISLMILLAFSSVIMQHQLFGTPFPRDRMTVVYLPALMICLVWITRFRFLTPMLATVLLIHFVYSLNVHATLEWKRNAGNLKLFETLNRQKELPQGRSKVFVAAGQDFFSVLNYYRISRKWNHLEQVFHEMGKPNPGADYMIFSPDDPHQMQQLEIRYADPVNGNFLARNSTSFQITPVSESKTFQNPYDPNQVIFEVKPETEFAGEINLPAMDDSSNGTDYLRIHLEVFPEKAINRSTGIILSFECENGTCDYRYFNLFDQLSGKRGSWLPVEVVYPVLPELKGKVRMKIYIWNNNAQWFRFRNMAAEYLKYKRI